MSKKAGNSLHAHPTFTAQAYALGFGHDLNCLKLQSQSDKVEHFLRYCKIAHIFFTGCESTVGILDIF
jgi:hypothetical protein